MSKRKSEQVQDGRYQYKVLGRTMAEWTPEGKVRIPTKKLDPADVHMVVGGIVNILARFAPGALGMLRYSFNAHLEQAARLQSTQAELPLDQPAA